MKHATSSRLILHQIFRAKLTTGIQISKYSKTTNADIVKAKNCDQCVGITILWNLIWQKRI